MFQLSLKCTACETKHKADMYTLRCCNCESSLKVEYQDVKRYFTTPTSLAAGQTNLELPLPIDNPDRIVSLGEGNTPCVKLDALGGLLGLKKLYAKLEFMNPTGSFKDRGTSIMISVARENNVTEVVEDSSGNAGASVSAYAASAGIKAHIFVPDTAPKAKIDQIKVYGSEIREIMGSREDTTDAAIAFYKKRSLVYASHNLSPYFIEGIKTFAYEVFIQFAHTLPDHILIPVGNGSLFTGTWKAIKELQSRGITTRMPRLHCIQSSLIMPVVALYNGQERVTNPVTPTIAGGIAVADPPRLNEVLAILKESNGRALGVSDREILHWQKLLAEREGLYGEPTSAAAFAGLAALVNQGEIKPNDTTLIPITGFGLKDSPPF